MVRHARKWSSRAHRMAMQRLQLEYAAAGAEILALCERLGSANHAAAAALERMEELYQRLEKVQPRNDRAVDEAASHRARAKSDGETSGSAKAKGEKSGTMAGIEIDESLFQRIRSGRDGDAKKGFTQRRDPQALLAALSRAVLRLKRASNNLALRMALRRQVLANRTGVSSKALSKLMATRSERSAMEAASAASVGSVGSAGSQVRHRLNSLIGFDCI